MKKHGYRLVWLLIVLGFWGTAIFLVFAPDTIAAHFNAAGEADRYGSKYEALLLPAVSALMGGIFLLCARTAGKKGAALALVLQFLGMVLATAVLYAFGTAWYCIQAGVDLQKALAACVIPFIPWDLIKMVVALVVGAPVRRGLERAGLLES